MNTLKTLLLWAFLLSQPGSCKEALNLRILGGRLREVYSATATNGATETTLTNRITTTITLFIHGYKIIMLSKLLQH